MKLYPHPKSKKRVLFICKRRPSCYGESYGLLNSCRFLCNALEDLGVEAKTIEVIDNNFIDAAVTAFKPTHCFIEALWVVAEKFPILIRLHPKIKWYVRLHSNVPFIANEGISMNWIKKYFELQRNYSTFKICCNDKKMVSDIGQIFGEGIYPVYGPNIYRPRIPAPPIAIKGDKNPFIDIGCFGAIRPLKNQLIQAMAAIAFADKLGKVLRFHINVARIESHGLNVYKNLKSLFEKSKHQLMLHGWLNHPEFLDLIAFMDLGMQVSFSETFNIVTADFVYVGVPVVSSSEVIWLNENYQANPTNLNKIVERLESAWKGRKHNKQKINLKGLEKWNNESRKEWEKLLNI
ncbi:MAG TPA: hypothetical protein PL028_04670 [Bacteroidales bacterium]|nr:hypothetical protein [Bacteroidales bacterium]